MTTDYGRDTWCLDALRTGRYASGPALAAQRLYRRFITPRGDLRGGPDEQNFGLDLAGLCGAADTDEQRLSLEPRIINEGLKDEQIEKLSANVAWATNAGETTYTITINAETADGPFELVLDVDDVTVSIVGLSA